MEINFEKAPMCYWSKKMCISYLQRKLIVHSILYYELNNSVISDKQFDCLAKQLIGLQKQNKKDFKESEYYYCFCDFDGSTGFHIYDRLIPFDKEYLTKIAYSVLRSYQGGR